MGPHTDRTGNDLTLERLYALRFSPTEREAHQRLWRVLCEHYLTRYIPADAAVVDVGAGGCGFINHIHARRRIAVDLDPRMRERAAPGVEVFQADISSLPELLGPSSVDVAFASNVFEHLSGVDELLRVLHAIRTILRPGGRIIILQPNVSALGGRFWDFLDHSLPLTDVGVQEALRVAHYRIVSSKARFLPYTTKSRIPKPNWLLRLYLALPPAQWLFGKQMLVVATPES